MENLVNEPAPKYGNYITPEEYLAMEEDNGVRYEYWDGGLIAMAQTSKVHNFISSKINFVFRNGLNRKKCISFQESIALKIIGRDIFFLPDVIVTCDEKDLDLNTKTVENPTLILEVLSASTEVYDRSKKWEIYRRIKSLRYFLLVSQEAYRVEIYSRRTDTSIYSYQVFTDLNDEIHFTEWDIRITLADIYEDVNFSN